MLVPVLLIWAAAHMIYRSRQMEVVTHNFINASAGLLRDNGPAAARWRSPSGEESHGTLAALQEQTSRALQAEELIGHALADVERAFGRNSERVQTLVSSLGNQCLALQNLSDQLGSDAVPLMNHLQETTAHLQSVLDQNGGLCRASKPMWRRPPTFFRAPSASWRAAPPSSARRSRCRRTASTR